MKQENEKDRVVDMFAYGAPLFLLLFALFGVTTQKEDNSLNNTDNTVISEEHLNADTTPKTIESVQKDSD